MTNYLNIITDQLHNATISLIFQSCGVQIPSTPLISLGTAFLVPKSFNNYWLIFDFMFYFGILLAIIGTINLYSTLRYSDYNKCDSKYQKIYKQKLILIDNDKMILLLIFDQSTSMYWLKILYPFDIDFGDLLAKKDIASIINYLCLEIHILYYSCRCNSIFKLHCLLYYSTIETFIIFYVYNCEWCNVKQ